MPNKSMSCRNIREYTQDFGGMVAESMWQFIFSKRIFLEMRNWKTGLLKTGKMSQ